MKNRAYFGFENGFVNTGIGFGAEKGHPVVKAIMDDYTDVPFVKEDGTFDTTTCPSRNTKVLCEFGLVQNNERQIIAEDTLILPMEYFCPLDYVSD